MAEISTLSDPIKTAFFAADHAFGKPAEFFGVVADAFDATTLHDNSAAIQAAIDWSAAQGRSVLFGGGVYGHSGSLVLKSNASIIGIGSHNTKFKQLDPALPDCFVSDTGAGSMALKLSGFSIDGGWDKKALSSPNGNWVFDPSTMTQKGLHLRSSTDFHVNVASNRDGLGDVYHHIDDILIQNIAGTGLVTEGRGEMRVQGLDIRSCARWGADLDAYDCWFDAVTISVCGTGGMIFRSGNQRISNTKLWFTGMNSTEGYGVGLEIENGVTDIVASNIGTQDTWGTAFKVQGRGNFIQGNAETTGCLYNRWGYGPATRSDPIYVVELHRAQDSRIEVAVSDRFSNSTGAGVPRLIGLFTASPLNNRVIFNINESLDSITPPYDTTTPVYVDSGAVNAKCFNDVRTHTGRILLGSIATSELADIAHGVNASSSKSAGTQRWNSTTGQPVWATGGLASDPWVDAGGQIIATPV